MHPHASTQEVLTETKGNLTDTQRIDELISLAKRTLQIKPACDVCGHPFLHGSEETCTTCLRRCHDPEKRHRRNRLRCDCGETAVAVVYAEIKIGGVFSQEPLPVCEKCLRIEIDTVANYL